jgi:hypothetical protein
VWDEVCAVLRTAQCAAACLCVTATPTANPTDTPTPTPLRCLLKVDDQGSEPEVATDIVYITRRLLGLVPVPPSFRVLDPNIPPDAQIAARIDALGNSLDVDGNGKVDVATDIVYIARQLLGLPPVPASFRALDPSIPSDFAIAANIDALCP